MTPLDRPAHDLILAWCRSDAGKRQTDRGMPVMRVRADRRCVVIDAACFDSPILGEGDDWTTVLASLRANGYQIG